MESTATRCIRLRPVTRWLRLIWRAHVGLAFALGLFSSGLAALIALGHAIGAAMVPACEAATPAAPDFEVAPFAFDPEERALTFAQALLDEDYRSAYAMLAPELQPAASICEVRLEGFRAFIANYTQVALDPTRGGRAHSVAVTTGAAERAPAFAFDSGSDELDVWLQFRPREPQVRPAAHATVTLVRDGRVSGIEFDEVLTTLGPLQTYGTPLYADLTAFEETDIVIGQAPWELGGTLTLPDGPGPFPAVVLVPGSGYANRDSTGLAAKAFRDLAWGLASQGVAVLRYDKRTLTHALAFARQPDFTLDDELVDDALAAAALLRQRPRIDPARVFVLGTSLGGFAAPRSAQREPALAGLILYSAPTGALWEEALRSIQQHLRDISGLVVTSAERRSVEQMRVYAEARAAGVRAPSHMWIRRGYHRDRLGNRPEIDARDIYRPFLILHGALDQVLTREAMIGWAHGLRGRRDVVFRLYANHDHGLFDWRDLSGPDIRPTGHVSAEVVDDIARWIAGEGPERQCVDFQAWQAGCRGGPDAAFSGVVRTL